MATLPERSTAVLLYWARSAAAIKRSWARWTFAEAVIGSSSTIPPGPRNLGRSEPVTAVPLELARVERYGGAVREARSAQEVGHGSAEGVALGAGAFEGFQDFEPTLGVTRRAGD